MHSSINSYRIKRLLLSGDYVCTDSENQLFLLSPALEEPQLHNLQLQNIILPIEISFLSDNGYYCFPISERLTHCLTKLRGTSHRANIFPRCLLLSLATTALNIWRDRQLREEAMACLSVDNLWMDRNHIYVVWNKRGRRADCTERAFLSKLGGVLAFLWDGNEDARLIAGSEPRGGLGRTIDGLSRGEGSLEEVVLALQGAEPRTAQLYSNKKPERRVNRYSLYEKKLLGSKKKSIDKTELSL